MTPAPEPQAESCRVPHGEPTDRWLIGQLRRGSQDAARQLYLRYAPQLRALAEARCSPDLARYVDADDIVQSVFGSFFRGASLGYYDLPVRDELWALLLVITLNKIRAKWTFYRAAKRDVHRTTGGKTLEDAIEARATCRDADQTFFQLMIDEALGRLPPEHRAMMELRMEGHEVAEIAHKVGRSKRTVERILQEARLKLEGLLGEED